MPPNELAPLLQSKEMATIDKIIQQSITAGNPLIAADYGNGLRRQIGIKGVALAKLLLGMRSNWPYFRSAGIDEEFGDFVNAQMHITSKVAEKYADMYQDVLDNERVPEETRNQLAGKPIRELLLLTAAVREGNLDNEDLEDVVLLDYEGIRQRVRAARGDVTSSKSAIYARLVSRQEANYPPGTLVVFGDGEIEPIATFKLQPETEAGKKYLARLINAMNLEDIR